MEWLFYPIALLLIVGAIVWNVMTREGRVARRRIKATPLVSIHDAPAGARVHISGVTSVPGEPLVAPLSGRRCAAYEVVVERYSSGRGSGWSMLTSERASVPFVVRDETGTAVVDPANAQFDLQADFNTPSRESATMTPALEAFLTRRGQLVGVHLEQFRQIRYREMVLAVGERVAVVGDATREPSPEPTEGGKGEHLRATPMGLRIAGTREAPVLLSDDPRTSSGGAAVANAGAQTSDAAPRGGVRARAGESGELTADVGQPHETRAAESSVAEAGGGAPRS